MVSVMEEDSDVVGVGGVSTSTHKDNTKQYQTQITEGYLSDYPNNGVTKELLKINPIN